MEDISLHILDIAENSIGADATLITISISEDTDKDLFTVEIEDNGRGIPEDMRSKVLDPFCTTRTTRKVGLGLPLLAQAARETGGDISVRPGSTSGTIVTADFQKKSYRYETPWQHSRNPCRTYCRQSSGRFSVYL